MDVATLPEIAAGVLPYALAAPLAATLVLVIVAMLQGGAARREMQRLRILSEQSLAGQRAEAEATRMTLTAAVQRIARGTTDRLAAMGERVVALRGELRTGLERVRTTLSREQGELRLALAEGQDKSDRQIGAQFESTRAMLESKLREMRESNEGKLAEIQKTVNEQLHAAVEKQMDASFSRVIDQFTAVQKAMGDVQAVTAQIGDIKRLFSNVRTRGGWGEAQVRAMLDDVLPPGSYEANCKLRPDSDEAVEFAVLMPMRGTERPLLPIDAKFPVETTSACWQRRRRAMPRPSGSRGAGPNAASATRPGRSRRNTSARRSRSSSPCSICPPTHSMPRSRASRG
jgi:DNA recombination protein RmuC